MMIQRIRTSRTFKGLCLFMAMNILAQIISPVQALALSGGAAQPEFGGFTAIGTSDMVNLSTGDATYNIPLMDVGGYPLNIAYSSGVGMDDEAPMVGLGWNLSVGQINHNVRGLPDDFDGDAMQYENHLKPNITVGGSFKFTPNVFGATIPTSVGAQNDAAGGFSVGVDVSYNNYNGFEMKPSVGLSAKIGNNVSVGFNVSSGPDGLCLSPSVSMHDKAAKSNDKNHKLGGSIGCSFNSRQGLTAMTLSMNKKTQSNYKNKAGETKSATSSQSVGSTIGFTDQVYTPSIRNEMVTGSFTVNAALGSEFFGGEGQGQITAYGTVQALKSSEKNKSVASYGYPHSQNANESSMLDFNREKEGALSINMTNLPLTNYTYDIHSVQGQGVSGMYRPYKSQVGYIYDAKAEDGSTSGSLGLEFGVGNAVHFGMDMDVTQVNSHSGLWNASNVLNYFKNATAVSADYEQVYYKNVGDLSVDRDFTSDENNLSNYQLFNRIGGYDPVRVPLVGFKFFRNVKNRYAYKWETADNASISINSKINRSKRQMRNQSIVNLTNQEVIDGKGYSSYANPTLTGSKKAHHVGEIQILRNDGARYVYGLPAYNITKREATFAVEGAGADCNKGLVSYNSSTIANADYSNLPHDQYFNRATTPAYVHTHLLTQILSTDYQDLTGNGPSEDDLGSYTKFNYDKTQTPYEWRVPLENNKASFNEGLKTDPKDDQGNYVYGKKELYYISSIETKTHIAFFDMKGRKDALGVLGEHGGVSSSQTTNKLTKIRLYSKAEYDANPSNTVPIKEVHFVYNYDLCKGVPNNLGNQTLDESEMSNNGGKLTLQKIYFTYKHSKMGKYTGYEFDYNESDPLQNPDYNLKGYDCWGNYKENPGTCANTSPITAAEFPYVDQDQNAQNKRAAVWCLKSIDLPSGGSINIEYESDDYQWVQNKRTMRMFKIFGAGMSDNPNVSSSKSDVLFEQGIINDHKMYLYALVDETILTQSDAELKSKYLNELERGLIQFRFFMNMSQGGSTASDAALNSYSFDYVSGYAELDLSQTVKLSAGPSTGKAYLSIPVQLVDKEGGFSGQQQVNPISKAAWQLGRKNLSKYVYQSPSADITGSDDEDIVNNAVAQLFGVQTITNLVEVFTGPNSTLENKGIGRRFIKDKSWVRLMEPKHKKLGGGVRVAKVKMKDVWEKMNNEAENSSGGYQTMNYGQEYDYSVEGLHSGIPLDKLTSTGVATYEPVGNKENPFVQPVFSSTKHLLAPDDDNYIEKPFGESFFPSPQVTYSKVRVANLTAGTNPDLTATVKKLHKTGYVETEYYTSKDYPTIVDQTFLEAHEDKTGVLGDLLKVRSVKKFTASQGYVVHLNDMDGKEKSKRVFAEGQSSAISGVDYLYDNYASNGGGTAAQATNSNKGRLNNKVTVIYPDGTIKQNTIGVEYDVVNDFRENATNTVVGGGALNTAGFFLGIFPGFVPLVLPKISTSKDQSQTISTTKVINTFGILKETIAYDAGTSVSTRNLAWDAMTGEILLTETVDEYSDKYYTFNYPAHWAYSGMGQAAANIGFIGQAAMNGSGACTLNGSPVAASYLIDGDEIAIGNQTGYNPSSYTRAWVMNVNADNFDVIDKDGNALTLSGNHLFKVVRSGHRNLQSAGIMNVTLMHNPLTAINGAALSSLSTQFLSSSLWSDYRIINAGAVDYSDNWPDGCECNKRGDSDNEIVNPYFRNEKGVWRTKSSRTYLTGRNSVTATTGRREGFFTSFIPFYRLSAGGNWHKDQTNWTFVSEVSLYSPYGFEKENKDALNRFSGAQYGYNHKFPVAVGANTKYNESGFDGFEDYGFTSCDYNAHFRFKEAVGFVLGDGGHTGHYSVKVGPNSGVKLVKKLFCPPSGNPQN